MKNVSVIWYEDRKTGNGMLRVDQDDKTIARIPYAGEPICAETDADTIVGLVFFTVPALRGAFVETVDHDGNFIHARPSTGQSR